MALTANQTRKKPQSPLKELRMKAGIDLTEAAYKLGISVDTVRHFESRFTRLPPYLIMETAQLYKVPITTIVKAAYYS